MGNLCDVMEASEHSRSLGESEVRQLHASKIRLLVQLDQTLRLLGVNLLAANLYTEDLDEDVLLRLELCKTTMLRERVGAGIGASWYDADLSLQVRKSGRENHSQR